MRGRGVANLYTKYLQEKYVDSKEKLFTRVHAEYIQEVWRMGGKILNYMNGSILYYTSKSAKNVHSGQVE
jgi:hypothetical protein